MVERNESGRGLTGIYGAGALMAVSGVNAWFIREVLPLEAALMQFLRRCVRDESDAADLRQDVYVRVYEAALKQIPNPVRPFLFTTARNMVVDRVRREQVVSIEAVADLDELEIALDEPGPERAIAARQELRRLQAALDQLPPRSRQAMMLRKIEGLSRREIASRMGIAEQTVAEYLASGAWVLAEWLHAPPEKKP